MMQSAETSRYNPPTIGSKDVDLSLKHLFLDLPKFTTLDIEYDLALSTLWVTMTHPVKPSLTTQLIDDFNLLVKTIQTEHSCPVPSPKQKIKFVVLKSISDEVFNLGGDLDVFVRAISRGDADVLQAYGRSGANACCALACGFDASIVTISLVRGLAIGGGFEAARCCDIMVAEDGATFQLPEVDFGLFAASGVLSVIAPRIGHAATRRLVIDGEKLDCAAAKAIDLIDEVALPGEGESRVRAIIKRLTPRHAAAIATYRGLSRRNEAIREALLAEADFWARAAMNLAPESLARMRGLSRVQARRFISEKKGAVSCQ